MVQVDEMATSTKSTLEVEESPPAKKPRTDSGDEVVADAEAASLAPPRTDSDVPSSSWTVKKLKTFLRERGGKSTVVTPTYLKGKRISSL